MRSKVSLVLAGLLVGVIVGWNPLGPAQANHQPADKVIATGSKLVVSGPNENVPVLTGKLKTSSPTDLILTVSMECSIFTQLVTGGGDQSTDSATAAGHIRAWVEIDGQIVPINSSSAAPAPGNDSDKVTFCNRAYSRTVTDDENPLDGLDIEDDYIDTKNANSFTWLRLNMGPGIHTIVVKASLVQTTQGDATARAAIGNRSIIVEPAKLANDATV